MFFYNKKFSLTELNVYMIIIGLLFTIFFEIYITTSFYIKKGVNETNTFQIFLKNKKNIVKNIKNADKIIITNSFDKITLFYSDNSKLEYTCDYKNERLLENSTVIFENIKNCSFRRVDNFLIEFTLDLGINNLIDKYYIYVDK